MEPPDEGARLRLRLCRSLCPYYRTAVLFGACLYIRDGSERVSADLYADALYRKIQPTFCPVPWDMGGGRREGQT
jgi:hypothetical protein